MRAAWARLIARPAPAKSPPPPADPQSIRILDHLRSLFRRDASAIPAVAGIPPAPAVAAVASVGPSTPRRTGPPPPPLLDLPSTPSRPLRHSGPIAVRTTHLLPRMVARLGQPSFDKTRLDYLESLPELRLAARDLPDGTGEQIAALTLRVREHARAHPPDPASFPALALRVMDRATDRRAGTDEVVSLVAQDAAIAASILRIANSPRYHRGGPPIAQLKVAVAQLGLDEVRRVAAAVASRSLYDLENVASYSQFRARWDSLFHRSMTVAFTAGWLAGQLKTGTAERAFLGGMFHDIGKTLALRSLSSLLMSPGAPPAPAEAVVDGTLEALHVEMGAALHEVWRLPDDLTQICRQHHDAAPPAEPELRTLHVVRVCSALADLRAEPAPRPDVPEMVRSSVRALRVSFKQYRVLTARLNAFAEQVSTMFHLEVPGEALPEGERQDE